MRWQHSTVAFYENEIAELKATIERLKANAARGVDLKAENRLPLRRESTGSNGSPVGAAPAQV